MNTKKFISFLLIVGILCSFTHIPINVKAENSNNILLGIVPETSTTDAWMLENRPISNITNGTGTTLTNDNNAWATPGRLDNMSGETYSWCRFDFTNSKKINKIVIQQHGGLNQSKDIAIDVLLSSGGWKRVGLKYNIADTYHGIVFAFETEEIISLQISFDNKRTGLDGTDIAEIEAYYDKNLTQYDVLQNCDDSEFEIKDSFESMNLIRGIMATSSNTDEWFNANRPISNITDGSGTVFSVGWEAEYGEVASITANENTGYAWVKFELPQVKKVNKIIIQQIEESSGIIRTKDFVIDVLLENHKWKRVTSSYDTEFTYSGFYLTFEPEKALAIRIIGITDTLNLKEVEVYYDSDITEFDGIGNYDVSVNGIQSPKKGDLNADYSFDAADLIVLRRQLLNIYDNRYFVDQNEDGLFNVIDLVAMKKNLIKEDIIDSPDSYGTIAKQTDTKAIEEMVNDDIGGNGRIYYVDAVNGNDSNDGLSKDRALLSLNAVNRLVLDAGDKVLFKRGCVWNGELVLTESGTKSNPIIIGMYGEGTKPMINGCGEVTSTILLADASYVTIRNLEVTNYKTSDVTDFRTCISVVSRKKEVIGVKIQNNYVHASSNLFAVPTGSESFYHFAAINLEVENGQDWNGEDIYIKNILIENNRVEKVNGNGIAIYGGLSDVEIKNNIVNNVRGDGIILAQCFNSVAEYNTVYSSGWGGIGRPHVNIWCYNATNTILQYNESYDCQSSVSDGQGFDIDDACVNCTVQYNYSHDNVGGFFIGCAYYKEYYGNVVRYNISQNDKKQFLFLTCPSKSTLDYDPNKLMYDIYNNTFYTTAPISDVIYNDLYKYGYTDYGKIRNNIFYVVGSPNPKWGKSNLALEFSNNCFYGISSTSITDKAKITMNPMLLAAGTGKIGRATCGGYQLSIGSPCLNSGVAINQDVQYDFWDNQLKSDVLNIGAYGGSGVQKSKDMNHLAGRIASTSFTDNTEIYYLNNFTDEKISSSVVSKKRTENTEEWIEFTFDESIPLSCVWLTAASDSSAFPLKYELSVYKNGEWLSVGDSQGRDTPSNNETIVFNFSQIETEKLKLTIKGMPQEEGEYYFEIAEIAAFSFQMAIN